MAKNWLNKYDTGGTIDGPKVPPIKLAGTEVYEHGEDDATADHQENGIEPTNLTEKGVKYAKTIGKQAAKQKKNTVISSDIERAVQTADIMANESGMQHITSPLLRTWNIGKYDGAPEGSFKEKQWVKNPNTAPAGGEPFSSFAQRMEQAYDMVKKAPSADDVVTHSKVTRAFKALESTGGQWTDKTTKKFASLKDEPKTKAKDGMNLEKVHDNYGKQGNYNDASASTGPDYVGLGYDTTGRNYSPAWGGQFAMGGSIPGAVGFTYARTAGSAPANGKYTKKTKASAQNGKEMSFYQNGLDFTPKSISKNGSIIKDDMGQWAHPGEITEIGSNKITMKGVPYDVTGISDEGDIKEMKPGKDYKFKGTKVTEYPQAQNGWLDKYK